MDESTAIIVLTVFPAVFVVLFVIWKRQQARIGTNANSSANPMGLICPLMLCILGVMALVHGIRALMTKK